MHYKRETELKLPSNKKKKVEHFALFHTQKSSRHYISFFCPHTLRFTYPKLLVFGLQCSVLSV